MYYMSGHIFNNCYDKEPYRNGPVLIKKTKLSSNTGQTTLATDSTDANGYFKIYYTSTSTTATLILKTGNNSELMDSIPPNENLDDVDVYARVYANIKVSLNVINPHAAGDTLIIGFLNAGGGEKKIPCPLTSGPIYTGVNWSPINTTSFSGTRDRITHNFRINRLNAPAVTPFKIDKYCQDTVYVTVDIK
jgi:hypothetical protein